MSIFGDLTGLGTAASAADGIIRSITELIGRFIPDPVERQKAENELQKILAESYKHQFEAMASVMTADANSESAFTRNARPTVVYWSLGMITMIGGAGLAGYSDPIIAALSQVPEKLYELIAYGIGAYAIGRSAEKSIVSIADAVKSIVTRKK